MPTYVITNMLYFWHSKNLPKLDVNISASLYSKCMVLVVIVGLYFIVIMMFLHGSASDCGFTIEFLKAAGLINGQNFVFTR